MSDSSLVSYTRISPNHSSGRAGCKIDRITVHYMAGNLSVEGCASVFAPTSRQASSNYGVGSDGRVGLYVHEADRAWTTASAHNDRRAVTIEVANVDSYGTFSDKAWDSLVRLCADICKRNGIPRIAYTGRDGTLTRHCDYSATSCPGRFFIDNTQRFCDQVNALLDSGAAPSAPSSSGSSGASLLLDCDCGRLTMAEWARQLGLSGSDADGYVSYQYSGNKKYLKNWSSAIYNWFSGTSGSPTVKAIQRRIGSPALDGVWGARDTEALRGYMQREWGYKMTSDGWGVFGANTTYNVQHSLNLGLWAK